jgi:antitoxin component YwqK of YwqJK toxin-antitoxin module
MKYIFFLLSIFFLITSCNDTSYSSSNVLKFFGGKRILKKELVKDGGLLYYEGTPFNGIAFAMYDEKNIEFEISIKDGKFDGEKKYWYRNSQIKQIKNYKNGILNGKWTAWYENGQIEAEGFYKDGDENGKRTAWYENGQIEAEGFYKDGDENGKWTTWYENGNKKLEAEYKIVSIDASISDQYCKNGGRGMVEPSSGTFDLSIMIGKYNEWHENGQLQRECFYNEKGNLDGFFSKWDDDGSLYEKKLYKDGDLIN